MLIGLHFHHQKPTHLTKP